MIRKYQKKSVVHIGAIILASLVGAIVVPMPTQAQYTTVNPENRSVRDEADRLLDLGQDQFKNGKPREAIKTWLYAIGYYRNVNDQAAISFTLARVSEAYELMGASKAAQDTMRSRIEYGNTLKDQGAVIQESNNLASLAIAQGNLESATRLSNNALEISQQREQSQGQANALNNQGLIARSNGDYLQSLKLYYASIKVRPRHDVLGNAYTYVNSGDSLMALDNYKAAIQDYETALSIGNKHRNYKLMSIASDRLIAAYLEVPNFHRIEKLLQNRSSLALVMGEGETAAIVQRYLGDLYLSFGNLPKARLAYQDSYDFAAMLGDTSSLPLREAYFKLQALERM
jgi:tetratricopeptide (TPR) repeat protein